MLSASSIYVSCACSAARCRRCHAASGCFLLVPFFFPLRGKKNNKKGTNALLDVDPYIDHLSKDTTSSYSCLSLGSRSFSLCSLLRGESLETLHSFILWQSRFVNSSKTPRTSCLARARVCSTVFEIWPSSKGSCPEWVLWKGGTEGGRERVLRVAVRSVGPVFFCGFAGVDQIAHGFCLGLFPF